MSEKEQNHPQNIRLTEVDGLISPQEELNENDCLETVGTQKFDINEIFYRLKDVEKKIFERIKYLDELQCYEKRGRPVSESTVSVAKQREISGDTTSTGKTAAATLDDVFVTIQARLDRLYESEDAVSKHGSDQRVIVEKQIKNLKHEVDALRTSLAEKRDELTTAKMKIDGLRVLKNYNIYSATSQLRENLKKITTEFKQCSQVIEEQNREIKKLKDSIKYLKNTLSIYKSYNENEIDFNKISVNQELKIINPAEENILCSQIELINQISQIEVLSTGHNDLNPNVGSYYIVSKSMLADTHGSENEQMRLAILPTQLIDDDANILRNSLSEELKPTLAEIKLKEKTALVNIMKKDIERTEQKINELKEINEMLNLEKIYLEDNNRELVKNEAILVDKFNKTVIQLEEKQNTIATLETLVLKLRAEIKPLQFVKDNLENKFSTFIDCNAIQLKRIECLEMISEELKNERERFIETNQNNLEIINPLQHDELTLKKEKFKSEVEESKNKNDYSLNDVDNLKSDKNRLNDELEKSADFYRAELIRYQNLLAEERNEKHDIGIELLKAIKELQFQVSEQHKLSKQENKEFETKHTFSDFDSKNPISDSPSNTINVLEVALEYEQKKNVENKKQIEDKNAEIEHLNNIKNSLDKKITDYTHKLEDQSSVNIKLQLQLASLENYVKVLENEIETFRVENRHKINDENLLKLKNDLTQVLYKNEMLSKELIRVLDNKEKNDKILIEANQDIAEFETYKKKIIVLSDELKIKNQIIESLTNQSRITETVLKVHQAKADEDKRIFELKLLGFQNEIEKSENKYKRIFSGYEIMKKQKTTEDVKLISEKTDDFKLKADVAEKKATEWEKKYNKLLTENFAMENKFENLNVKLNNSENYVKELENKNKSLGIKEPSTRKIIEDVVHLEIRNASLTRKLSDFYEKYSRNRAHLDEIKTMITNHNLKNILRENIDLSNTRDKLKKDNFNLKCHCQDLSRQLLEKIQII